MKLIVGLGNPGVQYADTRHNIGFQVVTHLAHEWSIPLKNGLCRCRVGQGLIAGHPVFLALPQTSMNRSGEGVGCLIRRLRLDLGSLLVVCDDVSLPLGVIRLRPKGSAGGHKGLGSVLDLVHSQQVARLRVGIQAHKLPKDLTVYVLGRFTGSQKRKLKEVLSQSVEACRVWIASGILEAMNRFNRRVEECRV